jgi:NADH-quinone oxidoreductase subunit L
VRKFTDFNAFYGTKIHQRMSPEITSWSILITPLLVSLIISSLGRKHNALSGWISVAGALVNFGFSILFFLNYNTDSQSITLNFNWFIIGKDSYIFSFLIDHYTLTMLFVVNVVALLVQIFSLEYMHHDRDLFRYFAYLNLFVFSMLGIVLTDSLFVMYAFWELVGLSSYLLIGFWYESHAPNQAAKKAFLMNRIGDAGFLLGIFLAFYLLKTSSLTAISHLDFTQINPTLLTATGLLLFCGCVGKSAQFPLHTWLPDAMEGPTPVSALIHAATMVAAGIFMLVRVHPLLTPDAKTVIAVIGTITMLLGAFYAIFQTDIKKTLAYSTVSQLGLMVIAIALSINGEAAFGHLFSHAFFKAGLFLCAGAIIHVLHHTGEVFDAQDMRLMGGLAKKTPIIFVCFTLCSAALMGLPFTTGAETKFSILKVAFDFALHQNATWTWVFPIAIILGISMTAFYSVRQILFIFVGNFRNKKVDISTIQERNVFLNLPIILLALASIIGLGTILTKVFLVENSVVSSWKYDAISEYFAIGFGLLTGWLTYQQFGIKMPRINTFDSFYDSIFVKPTLNFAHSLHTFDSKIVDNSVNYLAKFQVVFSQIIAWFDRSFIDGIPNGSATIVGSVGRITQSFQNGKVQWYFVAAFLGILTMIILIAF